MTEFDGKWSTPVTDTHSVPLVPLGPPLPNVTPSPFDVHGVTHGAKDNLEGGTGPGCGLWSRDWT